MGQTDLKKSTNSVLLDKAILREFPKVELHRHLEGTFPLQELFELSVRNELATPKELSEFKQEFQFPKDSEPDFLTFLGKFKNDWYRSLDDVRYIAYHSVRHLADDGIFFIELRFSPEHFAAYNDFSRTEVTNAVIDAGNQAAEEVGVGIRYLLTFNRSKQTEDEMIELYDALKDVRPDDVSGIDLAGDEINYPGKLFKRFFKRINDDGVYGTTVHAGEVTPASQVWEAIHELGANRIGHGTSSTNDPELQSYLREHGIALELCITSNYQTGSWSDEPNHPLGSLYRAGVPVTINSDDPSIQDTDLTDDYAKAVRYFGFTIDDLIQLNLTALSAAFLDEPTKKDYIRRYNKRVKAFRKKHGL